MPLLPQIKADCRDNCTDSPYVAEYHSQYTTQPSHHLHTGLKTQHITTTSIIHYILNNFNSQDFNHYKFLTYICITYTILTCRSQWPRGLRRSSSAVRLLRFWVRIPPGIWMFVCCECCVLSGRSLWNGLITRPEESYRLWRVVVCDQETSKTRRLKSAIGL